jgi:hypothetical protein
MEMPSHTEDPLITFSKKQKSLAVDAGNAHMGKMKEILKEHEKNFKNVGDGIKI